MSFLKKLFGKEEESPKDNPLQSANQEHGKTEQELLEQYGGIGLDKQRNLYEVIGNNAWNADLSKGEISFGGQLAFPIQVLGTFSHSSKTWLWAWANDKSSIPPNLLQQALYLKNHGEAHEIPLLKHSEFDAEINDLHLIGMIASGMFNTSAYYLADYGQGIMLVTFQSAIIDKNNSNDVARISTVFPELISTFETNHRNAFKNYVTRKGYTIDQQENQIVAENNGKRITAAFDELSRLTKLQA
ncbi:DUF6882 domain-containing protein [Chitinophaga arvensicola]|uniref:Uncharacterized protein n=1 Tax=Chitinophaga arvensicola TaxID=29529 RepID=A0A1I0SAV3_9BACT|nr:DUF6882 domain-containing protein [Chitinophaga arvensicola]SEW53520.1 hypothetical protein SAMN04488122_5531 [Chitinophaga arvensicola]